MGMDQMIYAHPETWLNATGGGSGSGGISSRSTHDPRGGGATRSRRCSGWPRRSSASRSRASSVTGGVVSGGGKTVTYGELIGGKLFNFKLTARTPAHGDDAAGRPRAGIAKPVERLQGRRQVVPADRHPGEGERAPTPTSRTSASRGCCTAACVRPRGAGANTSQNHFPLSVDASSIKHIPGAQVVQIKQLPRRRGAEGVRRDPGGGAAEGGLEERSEAAGLRQLLGLAAPGGRHEHAEPGPLHDRRTGNVDTALAGAAKTVSATYMYQYNGFMPIGPHCAVADVRRDENRATVFAAARSRSTACRRTSPACSAVTGDDPGGELPRDLRTRARARSAAASRPRCTSRRSILSAKLGKPVRVQWMRWDQHGWDHYGMANL